MTEYSFAPASSPVLPMTRASLFFDGPTLYVAGHWHLMKVETDTSVPAPNGGR
jgi:hypothetical protein